MNQERRIGLGLLATGVIGFLIVVGIVIANQASALKYTMVFDDAKGLQKGDKVQINGVDVGTVKSVKLTSIQPPRVDVVVRIYPEQAPKVRSDSTAFIGNVSLPNVSGQKVVEILNPSGEGAAPMKAGSEIKGLNSIFDLQAWKLRQGIGNAAESLSEKIGETAESIKSGTEPARGAIREKSAQMAEALREKTAQWSSQLKDAGKQLHDTATNPKVKELYQSVLDRLEDFIALMREKGAAAIQELQARWESIKTEIGPMLDQLCELGQKYVADTFRRIMIEIEQALDKMRAQPTPAPTMPPPAPRP